MSKQYSVDFFTSLLEAVQKLCREYLEFDQYVDVSGYIALELDNYKKERFVISELLQKSGDFMSESYCTKAFKTSRSNIIGKLSKKSLSSLLKESGLSVSTSSSATQTDEGSQTVNLQDSSQKPCQQILTVSTGSQTLNIEESSLNAGPKISAVSMGSQTLKVKDSLLMSGTQVSTISFASQTESDCLPARPHIAAVSISSASQTVIGGNCLKASFQTNINHSLTQVTQVSTLSDSTQTPADFCLPLVSTASSASQTNIHGCHVLQDEDRVIPTTTSNASHRNIAIKHSSETVSAVISASPTTGNDCLQKATCTVSSVNVNCVPKAKTAVTTASADLLTKEKIILPKTSACHLPKVKTISTRSDVSISKANTVSAKSDGSLSKANTVSRKSDGCLSKANTVSRKSDECLSTANTVSGKSDDCLPKANTNISVATVGSRTKIDSKCSQTIPSTSTISQAALGRVGTKMPIPYVLLKRSDITVVSPTSGKEDDTEKTVTASTSSPQSKRVSTSLKSVEDKGKCGTKRSGYTVENIYCIPQKTAKKTSESKGAGNPVMVKETRRVQVGQKPSLKCVASAPLTPAIHNYLAFSWDTDDTQSSTQTTRTRSLYVQNTDVYFTQGTQEYINLMATTLCAIHRFPFHGVKEHPNFQKALSFVLQQVPALNSFREKVEKYMLSADIKNWKSEQRKKVKSDRTTRVEHSTANRDSSSPEHGSTQTELLECPVCHVSIHDELVLVCCSCEGVYHDRCVVLPIGQKTNWLCSLCSDVGDDIIKSEPMDEDTDTTQDIATKLCAENTTSSEASELCEKPEEQPIGTQNQLDILLKIFSCTSKAQLVRLAQKGIPRDKLTEDQKSLLDSLFYNAFRPGNPNTDVKNPGPYKLI